jgi:hypothetical protein
MYTIRGRGTELLWSNCLSGMYHDCLIALRSAQDYFFSRDVEAFERITIQVMAWLSNLRIWLTLLLPAECVWAEKINSGDFASNVQYVEIAININLAQLCFLEIFLYKHCWHPKNQDGRKIRQPCSYTDCRAVHALPRWRRCSRALGRSVSICGCSSWY